MTTTYEPSDTKVDASPPDEDIQALLEISDEEFTDILTEALMEANGPTSQEPDWQCLLHPEVVGRTSKAMGRLALLAQAQLGEASARLAEHLPASELADARKVRGRLLLFRSRLISRGTEAKEIRRRLQLGRNGVPLAKQPSAKPPKAERLANHVRLMENDAKEARDGLRVLALAIQHHRLAAVSSGLSPEPADRELWSVLDKVRLPKGAQGSASLTELLGSGAWTDEVA